MTNNKYKIMPRIYQSSAINPLYRKDFYTRPRNINANKRCIDELVNAGLLIEGNGSGRLSVTTSGVEALEQDIGRREDIRRISIQFWISAIFSLAALAVSIISLII